jgi:hypothetical protein
MNGPACGNNPNYRMSDGDRRAVDSFRAYLTARGALQRIRTVLETEAVVGRTALEYRGLITAALMDDETAATETQPADLPTLAAALDGLHTLIATSSRDWGTYRVDAWIWAVLCGWDCEQTEHDDTCVHGALEEMQERHGWDDATVAKARRYRAAVRALVEKHQPAAETQPEACPPGCVACATDESHDPAPATGARQDGAQR